ncbi:hypothetical protein RND71_009833 [Anisodus tanguticus]|uniref:R13L1/DRL21-like LRR repeat region domain-containing protein n=1 Tax=Anisodus tanguticus TaxID=243964 RepID=A0AAE1VHK6_9SOLA|nr:hypothetical protein RND71_009833 [Anisodus tanguticus]
MEKSINLRHLDISNTSHLKIPLHPCKLKSLHMLLGAKFLLGGRSGSRMEDLGELRNLYGSLSILELQNLVKLSLRNCKDCDSLPALGQLPSLKFLAIRGMHRITEVTEEFYGSSCSKKPFNSLEKLTYHIQWDMVTEKLKSLQIRAAKDIASN